MTTVPAVRNAIAACHDVEVVYGEGDAVVRALSGVSLELRPADRVALLGRSGSGKTTVLHVLGGLVRPTRGRVEPAARVAYIFQGADLLPHFTAFENVAFAAELAQGPANPALAASSLLELVGLGAKLDQLPAELSGGEAQRVAIARALAQRPELLLCDEPTGHLDSDTGERVLDLIDALQNDFGFALVVATHARDVAARYGRELELEDGIVIREDDIP
jgi:ABC-type lipoprotein export system ATPase subunit